MISKEKIKRNSKKYGKSAHSGHFAGEDPEYHYEAGANWALREVEPMFLEFRNWWMQLTSLERAEYFNVNKNYDISIEKFKEYLKK